MLSFPLAYYAARLATPRMRNALLIAVVLPLWANYLVRVFAWKIILTPNGFLNWLVELTGHRLAAAREVELVRVDHVRLPVAAVHAAADLRARSSGCRTSFLEASSDLGARGWTTFRSVMFPLILPGIVAGSIFAFSLTLGDYIAPELVGNTQFIGNVIFDNVGVAGNIPLAAAYAMVPLAIMAVYLLRGQAPGRVRGAVAMESRAAQDR